VPLAGILLGIAALIQGQFSWLVLLIGDPPQAPASWEQELSASPGKLRSRLARCAVWGERRDTGT
jgi:hypothetical protein